jgi:hypothetical protein
MKKFLEMDGVQDFFNENPAIMLCRFVSFYREYKLGNAVIPTTINNANAKLSEIMALKTTKKVRVDSIVSIDNSDTIVSAIDKNRGFFVVIAGQGLDKPYATIFLNCLDKVMSE